MSDWICKQLNRINDWDLTWVGFSSLRPARELDMSARVVAILCLVYCPLSAAIAYGITLFTLGRRAPAHFFWIVPVAAAVAFVLMQSALAFTWNRRAASLRAQKKQNVTL